MDKPNMMRQDSTQLSGYLYKKSSGGDWQRRYFETNGNYLTYYKTHKMSKLLAAVSLPQVGLIKLVGEVNDGKGGGYVFQLDLKDRQYLLRGSSLEEAQRWVDYLIMLRDGKSSSPGTPQNNPLNSNLMASQPSFYNSSNNNNNNSMISNEQSQLYIEPKASIQKSSRLKMCNICCKR